MKTNKHILTLTIGLFGFALYSQNAINQNNETLTKTAKAELVSSDIETSVVKFSLDGFNMKLVQTSDGEENIVTVEKGTSMLIQGAPDIPKLTASLIIPDKGAMNTEIISSNYKEYTDVEIAPSKGNLTRDIDPSTMPYTKGTVYSNDEFFPGKLAELKDPYVFRDYRGEAIWVYPFQYNPVTKVLRVYSEITIKVSKNGTAGKNELIRSKSQVKTDDEFLKIYGYHFLNYQKSRYTPLSEQGNMLVICYDAFISAMQPFVDWKNTIGRPTEIVGISTVGNNSSSIKTYVTNYYNTKGLTYLLLVGDATQIPTFTATAGASDNSYGYITGGDSYPEVFVGRFSAEQVSEVQTQVQRTVSYELSPSTTTNWLNKGIGIGSALGPGDDNENDYQHIRNLRTKLMNFQYSAIDELYDGSQGGQDLTGNPTASMVATDVNAGVGIICYTGHGASDKFVTTGFSSSDVNNLTNNNMWPFIWSIACVNGAFTNGTCFAEAWLRATHNGQPSGAVAAFMSTINQSWNPPMEAEDEMVDIFTESYSGNIKRTFGGLSMNGCMKMNDTYNSAGFEMTDTWTIFGDPSLMVNYGVPTALTATYAPIILTGSTTFTVNTEPDAYVAVSINGILHGAALADPSGVANITLTPFTASCTAKVAATKPNRIPFIGTVNVTQNGTTLTVSPAYQNVSVAAGSTIFSVTSNISWTASSSDTWCTVTPSGTGNGTITANYSANSGSSQRTATITVSGSGVNSQTVTVSQSGNSSASACGLEEFATGITAPSGWTFTNIGAIYNSAGNYGNAAPSLKFDATGDAVETAPVSNPTQLSFWIKGLSTNASSFLLVEGYNGTSWATIENITGLPTTGTPKTYTSVSAYTKFRFTYTKGAGNLAFDDVNISCGTSSTLSVSPANHNAVAAAGSTTFSVTSNISWTASSSDTWCTVTPSGTGNGTITANYSAYFGGGLRITTIIVSGAGASSQTVTVTQSGLFPTLANDECSDAILLTQTSTYTPTSGTTVNATQSIFPITCNGTGNADDDVWYKFVATSTYPVIKVVGASGFDAVVDLRSGSCNGTNIDCADAGAAPTEVINATGLTIGSTYYIRVYSFNNASSYMGTFSIGVYDTSYITPANDDCSGAELLTQTTTFTPTNGTTILATQSIPAITCGAYTGTADDDVWYKFIATSTNPVIVEASMFDAVLDLRLGSCNGTNINCADATELNGTETINATGLNVGETYYIRVYSYSASIQGTFTIGVYDTPIQPLTVSPSNQNVSATAGSINFNVTSSISWTVTSDQSWCAVTLSGAGNGTITANYSANSGSSQRIATITVSGSGVSSQTVTVTQSGNSSASACGLEEFANGTTVPSGWTFTGIGATYTSISNSGNAVPSLRFDATGDAVETAFVSNPSQLSFWIKGVSTNAISALLVEGYNGTSWATIENITSFPTTGTPKTYNNVSAYTKFRFTYTKSAGNLAFDDVNIICGNNSLLSVSPANQNVSSTAGSTNFNVTSNTTWTATSNQPWCTVTPSGTGNTTLTANYTANTNTSQRTAIITVTASSITITVTVTQSGTSSTTDPEICIVTLDNLTGKNKVVWNKVVTTNIDHYSVYREVSSTGYTWLGAVPYSSTSEFTDATSNPAQQAYRYKLSAVYTNGVESNLSPYHKTIHLTISQGIGNTYNLNWDNYEGVTYSVYNIYRGTNPANLILLTSLPSTINSYTDLNPPAGNVYYQIVVDSPTPCSPSKSSINSTKSNITNNSQAGINSYSENSLLSIYPNPGTGIYTVEYSGLKEGKGSISVFDNLGRLVLAKEIDFDNNLFKTTLDISEFNDGIYSVKIEAGGNSVMKRIVKN